jgi:hypothetical protein
MNNCPSSLAPNGSCQINATFTPTAPGNASASIMIANNAPGSPQTAALSGTGQDFSVAPSGPSSATIAPGQAANYTVAVAPDGGFNQTVTLTCSGAPVGSSCSVSPSSVTLNGSSPASVKVTVNTAAASASLMGSDHGSGLALWLGAGLLGFVLPVTQGSERARQTLRTSLRGIVMLGAVCLMMTWSACGGGSNGAGTTAGTYTVTVTGTFTSGATNLARNTKLTLIVQ